jgi:hypothetical protein
MTLANLPQQLCDNTKVVFELCEFATTDTCLFAITLCITLVNALMKVSYERIRNRVLDIRLFLSYT